MLACRWTKGKMKYLCCVVSKAKAPAIEIKYTYKRNLCFLYYFLKFFFYFLKHTETKKKKKNTGTKKIHCQNYKGTRNRKKIWRKTQQTKQRRIKGKNRIEIEKLLWNSWEIKWKINIVLWTKNIHTVVVAIAIAMRETLKYDNTATSTRTT